MRKDCGKITSEDIKEAVDRFLAKGGEIEDQNAHDYIKSEKREMWHPARDKTASSVDSIMSRAFWG